MKKTLSDKAFDLINHLFMIFIVIITLYPFLNVLAISLNDPFDAVKGGITIFPRKFSIVNYAEFFNYPNIIHASLVSLLRTSLGTILSVLSTAMVAYVISRRDFFARKFMTILFIITMYVDGGMVPNYLLVRSLGLMNNFWVYILPGLISAFNVIIVRSFIDEIPDDIEESAMIDGANDLFIFFRIILPLCLPVLATITLFYAVGHWNSWFDTYLYCSGREELFTLQYELQKILSNASAASSVDYYANLNPNRTMKVTPDSLRMAMTIMVTVPILCVYPFVQKYFVKGMTLGAVKS